MPVGHPVTITTPYQCLNSTLVSKGATLYSLHKEFICTKVLKASVGFARDKDYDINIRPEPYDERIHGLSKVFRDWIEPEIDLVKDSII